MNPSYNHHLEAVRTHRKATGFTMIEAVISMGMVGVMLIAAMNTLGSAARARQINHSLQHQSVLAQQLMAEILQAAYEEPDDKPSFGLESGESGSNRENFDDLDDYHNWKSQPPTTKDGTTITQSKSREVRVEYVNLLNPTLTSLIDTGLKRITVTVYGHDDKPTTLVALRSKLSSLEVLPTSDTQYISMVNVDLQVGDDSAAALSSSTPIINRIVHDVTRVTFGSEVTGLAHQSSEISRIRCTLSELGQPSTINEITAYVKGPSDHQLRYAIYTDSGGEPGTKVVETALDTMGTSSWHWHTIEVSPTVLNAGTYWLAIGFSSDQMYYSYSSGGKTRHQYSSEPVFPSSWGTSGYYPSWTIGIYASGIAN